MKEKKDVIFLGGAFFGAVLGALLMLIPECASNPSPQVPPSEVVSTAAYKCVAYRTARQLLCTVPNRTKAEIDACRAGVQLAVDCTDGGLAMFYPAEEKDGGAE